MENTKYAYVVHAEQNAITDCAKRGVSTNNCDAYITHYPCIICTRLLLASGIKEIKYIEVVSSISSKSAGPATRLNLDEYIDNNYINNYAIDRLIDRMNLNKENTKFLSYFKKDTYTFNVNKLNQLFQYRFNPDNEIIPTSNKFHDKFTFRVGDIIIRTENDYSNEDIRANGEQAYIKYYNSKNNKISIFNNRYQALGLYYYYDDDYFLYSRWLLPFPYLRIQRFWHRVDWQYIAVLFLSHFCRRFSNKR